MVRKGTQTSAPYRSAVELSLNLQPLQQALLDSSSTRISSPTCLSVDVSRFISILMSKSKEIVQEGR